MKSKTGSIQIVARKDYLEIQLFDDVRPKENPSREAGDIQYKLEMLDQTPVIQFSSRTKGNPFVIHLNLPDLFEFGTGAWTEPELITFYVVFIHQNTIVSISVVILNLADSDLIRSSKFKKNLV